MCNSVYKSKHYMDCVRECAELSMQKAVDSVKSTPEYTANGEEMAVVHDLELISPHGSG